MIYIKDRQSYSTNAIKEYQFRLIRQLQAESPKMVLYNQLIC